MSFIPAILLALAHAFASVEHASCSGSVPVSVCKDGKFTDNAAALRKELETQTESCGKMKILLVGSEAGGLQALQSVSAEGVSGLKATVGAGKPLCVDSTTTFISDRLKVNEGLLKTMVPKASLRWCFQAVVSSEIEVIASAIVAHSPDAVFLARPASAYLQSQKQKPPKKRSVVNWLLSFLPNTATALKIDYRAVESTVKDYEELRTVDGYPMQPMLVITGVEVAKSRGMAGQLRDALQGSIPEVLFVEKSSAPTFRAALHVLYFRKFLALTDVVRELKTHVDVVDKQSTQASEREAQTLLTASRRDIIASRIASHDVRLREVQSEEAYTSALRILLILTALTAALFLFYLSYKILCPVFNRVQSAVSAISALGEEDSKPKTE